MGKINVSHTRTVVRECFKGDEASQWKRPTSDPSTLKPFDQPWQKLAWMTTSWTSLSMPNFIALFLGVFAPYIRDFPYHGVTFLTLFWVLATRYSLHP